LVYFPHFGIFKKENSGNPGWWKKVKLKKTAGYEYESAFGAEKI
jgi:hypothetical protein